MAWYHRPRRLRNVLSWVLKRGWKFVRYTADKVYDKFVGIGMLAFFVWAGWTFAVPMEAKEKVYIVTLDGLADLNETLKDLREWAQIEIERARAERTGQ